MFGLSPRSVITGAIVVAVIAGFALYTRWVYNQGVGNERRAQVESSLSRTADRNEDDEELRNLDLDGLCREYGYSKWVPENNGCK